MKDGKRRPEDVELCAVYDSEKNLLWFDESEFRGMGRREFLAKMGLTGAAIFFGQIPRIASAATTSVALSGTATGMKLFSDEVFSADIYTGNGSSQTIVNGIDLSGKGGMLWIKRRDAIAHQTMLDYEWGALTARFPNLSLSQGVSGLISQTSSGFSVNNNDPVTNASGGTYVAWTFREAPKFFAEGVATVNSTTTISFPNLETIGTVIVQGTFGNDSPFWVWHRSLPAGKLLKLNTTDLQITSDAIQVSGTTITLNSGAYDGGSVIVYAFAHDTSADGLIQCGSYTGNGTDPGAAVTLGWEPQLLIVKNAGGTGNWHLYDSARGLRARLTGGPGTDAKLMPNLGDAEVSVNSFAPTPNGFVGEAGGGSDLNSSGVSYVYIAIRRPNKPPSTATEVYSASVKTGAGTIDFTRSEIGFSPDFILRNDRLAYSSGAHVGYSITRLTNGSLRTNGTAGETNPGDYTNFNYSDGGFQSSGSWNGTSPVHHFFRRAPGFLDVVCYTGTGSGNSSGVHGLGAVPELVIFRNRSAGASWGVWHTGLGNSAYLVLNSNAAAVTGTFQLINTTPPTATNFSVWNNVMNNASGNNYVAYFFATKAGISKVGSYTGAAGDVVVPCGFSGSARFVLVKRTDQVGDWILVDSVRGQGYYLTLNTANAEVSTNVISLTSGGFTAKSGTIANVSGGTYIFLAIA